MQHIARRLVVAAGMFALTLAQPASAQVCSGLTGSCYDYINRNIEDTDFATWTWEGARADAESRTYLGRRGHLVTITSAAEEKILTDNWFGDILYGQPWLGGFRAPDSDPVAGWQWVTGESWGYTNWLAGEPNNSGAGEFFLHYQSFDVASTTQFGGWGWNDASNSSRGTAAYFIEYAPVSVPEPSTWLMLGSGLVGLGAVVVRRRVNVR